MSAMIGLTVLVLTSADARAGGDQHTGTQCDAQSAAMAAAVLFVRRHSRDGEYDLKRPRTEDWGGEWTVWFPRLEPVMPAHGLVAVQKADCSTAWVPLK